MWTYSPLPRGMRPGDRRWQRLGVQRCEPRLTVLQRILICGRDGSKLYCARKRGLLRCAFATSARCLMTKRISKDRHWRPASGPSRIRLPGVDERVALRDAGCGGPTRDKASRIEILPRWPGLPDKNTAAATPMSPIGYSQRTNITVSMLTRAISRISWQRSKGAPIPKTAPRN